MVRGTRATPPSGRNRTHSTARHFTQRRAVSRTATDVLAAGLPGFGQRGGDRTPVGSLESATRRAESHQGHGALPGMPDLSAAHQGPSVCRPWRCSLSKQADRRRAAGIAAESCRTRNGSGSRLITSLAAVPKHVERDTHRRSFQRGVCRECPRTKACGAQDGRREHCR